MRARRSICRGNNPEFWPASLEADQTTSWSVSKVEAGVRCAASAQPRSRFGSALGEWASGHHGTVTAGDSACHHVDNARG